MLTKWLEEDGAYLAILPELADCIIMPATHGSTYNKAVQRGQEVLETLAESVKRDGELLPASKIRAA